MRYLSILTHVAMMRDSFMTDTKRKLEAMGVNADRTNLELFTTGDVA